MKLFSARTMIMALLVRASFWTVLVQITLKVFCTKEH